MSGYPGFADFYERGPYAACVTQARRVPGSPLALIRSLQPEGEYPDTATPDLWLGLKLEGHGWHDVDVGAGRWQGVCRPGDMVLVPPGSATQFRQAAASHFLFVVLPPELSEEGWSGDLGSLHAAPFRDDLVEACARRLWEASTPAEPDPLFATTLAQTALAALRRRSGRPAQRVGALAPERMQRVIDFVEAHPGGVLSVARLAEIAGVSQAYFARAFTAACGQPPHRYVLGARLERARRLVETSDLPLVEIALDCGFGGQEHLTRHFTARFGAPPGACRRRRRTIRTADDGPLPQPDRGGAPRASP